MTKQHFEAIAKAMARNRPGANWDANKLVQWDLDVKALCDVFAKANPRFDRARFIAACGGLFDR